MARHGFVHVTLSLPHGAVRGKAPQELCLSISTCVIGTPEAGTSINYQEPITDALLPASTHVVEKSGVRRAPPFPRTTVQGK